MEKSSSNARLIMANLAVIAGLYFVFLVPDFLDTTQYQLIWKQTKQSTNFGPGPASRI